MKTHSLEWPHIKTRHETVKLNSAVKLGNIQNLARRLFVAAVPALAIIVGAAWAITVPSVEIVIQASIWAFGFIFLALAVEANRDQNYGWAIATGLALPILAILSSRVASEFLVVAAAVIATWVVAVIVRR